GCGPARGAACPCRAGRSGGPCRRPARRERARRVGVMSTALSPQLRGMLQRQTVAIAAAALLLVLGLGGWAMTTEFSGAVIAAGQLVVDTNVKKVQHPNGGVVGKLNVREGKEVKA